MFKTIIEVYLDNEVTMNDAVNVAYEQLNGTANIMVLVSLTKEQLETSNV